MAPRLTTRREHEADFSAVGTIGRRTGVTLPRGQLDLNGIEEISGIFSSPRKPSPTKQSVQANESTRKDIRSTPIQALSTRRSTRGVSIPPPRSISPKKTGIGGIARRSNGMDILGKLDHVGGHDSEDRENTQVVDSPGLSVTQRRLSLGSEKSPLRDITIGNTSNAARRRSEHHKLESRRSIMQSIESGASVNPEEEVDGEEKQEEQVTETLNGREALTDDYNDEYVPVIDDESGIAPADNLEHNKEEYQPEELDDEDVDQTFEPEPEIIPIMAEPTKANSRRKRKFGALEPDVEVNDQGSPIAKKTKPNKTKRAQEADRGTRDRNAVVSKSKGKEIEQRDIGQSTLRPKNPNVKLSSPQEKQLEQIVEKVKARPGQSKSLYILRRETPADDAVTHTRSGRISVKPLAYWRNERCVFGGSPGGASIEDGARFPLNSIKEIIRHEEIEKNTQLGRSKKKKSKGKPKAKPHVDGTDSSDSCSEDEESPSLDLDAEPWELEIGTLRGNVSVWDPRQQAPIEEEEEIDIAYAPAAVQTREVKGSSLHDGPTFRYAKLLSTKFFGTGIVDLPPGGIKRPKNSRKMHMSFFVVKGRVKVQVGPIGGDETGTMSRFSIGKGGFWQVPRGNQYSIENELERPARVFFSQGCEPAPLDDDA